MKTRSELREIIMIALYQILICEANRIPYDKDIILNTLLEEENEFAVNTLNGVLDNKNNIDENINKYLKNWTIDRLGKTDQAILRLGAYEIMYTDTPGAVIIDQAVELSKKYSDDKIKNMINAVLDNIFQKK
jgi:N utilization substance protein B